MKKRLIIALSWICLLSLVGCNTVPDKSRDPINYVIGYSALYDDELIRSAFEIAENAFSENFQGCTLTELQYDAEVENKFASEMEQYKKAHNRELLVILSTFETDAKGGDGSLNPNTVYENFQWRFLRSEDMKSWELIDWGY